MPPGVAGGVKAGEIMDSGNRGVSSLRNLRWSLGRSPVERGSDVAEGLDEGVLVPELSANSVIRPSGRRGCGARYGEACDGKFDIPDGK